MIRICFILLFAASLGAQEPNFEFSLTKELYKKDLIKGKPSSLAIQVKDLSFTEKAPFAAEFKSHKALINIPQAKINNKSFTIEAWVKVDQTRDWGGIVSAFQDNGAHERGWLLGYKKDKFCFTVSGEKVQKLDYMCAKSSFSPGFWYHLVGTYDGVSQKLYADGKQIAIKKIKAGPLQPSDNNYIAIGSYMDDNDFYPMEGQISKVAIFNSALSLDQIKKRFNKYKKSYPGIEGVTENKGDWTTYMGDNVRSGISPVKISFPLQAQWIYKARHKPAPAWPRPAKMDYWRNKPLQPRVTFDRAYHLVGENNRLYFGSSADHKIYCLDALSGKEVWSFYTEGPVRLAPTLKGNMLLAGSDDGFIYCLNSTNGELIWRKKLIEEDRRLPGNQHIISRWPVRTGVLIEENIAHFCAGIFPSQGVKRGAIDITNGKILADMPIKFSPQGYLKKNGKQIELSRGRNLAKAFLTKLKRNVKDISNEVNTLPADYSAAFIKAGDVQIGGGKNKIIAVDSNTGKVLWKVQVKGTAYSLAIIRGRLYASTDEGYIYCFGGKGTKLNHVTPSTNDSKLIIDAADKDLAAKAIAKVNGLPKGFLLAVNCSLELMCALTENNQYQIISYCKTRAETDKLRNQLDKKGLYGVRIVIHEVNQTKLPYTDGMFNVILDPKDQLSEGAVSRLLNPYNGLALQGEQLNRISKGKRPQGGGQWTHMYADPSNTNCSQDSTIGTKLELQWFGPPGPRKMIDRHHRTVAPLNYEGRLFIPGENLVICSDAWNGTVLWEVAVENSMRIMAQKDCSYLAVDKQHLYVAAADKCNIYKSLNGQHSATLKTSIANSEWGYLALSGNYILGSSVSKGAIRRSQSYENPHSITHRDYVPVIVSNSFFAFKKGSSAKKWSYSPKGGILNPSLCATTEAVFFIESHNPKTLTGQQTLKNLLSNGSSVVKLDIHTGRVVWRKSFNFSDLRHNIYLASHNNILICNGSKNINEKVPGVHKPNNGEVRYRIFAIDCDSGKLLWEKEMNPNLAGGKDHGEADRRPVIVNDKVYLEPFSYKLKDGIEDKSFNFAVRKRNGCGQLTASKKAFFFRHSSAGAFNIEQNKISKVTQVTRPGCWLNILPSNGLLLIPEASSGCICNFAIQSSMALRPVESK